MRYKFIFNISLAFIAIIILSSILMGFLYYIFTKNTISTTLLYNTQKHVGTVFDSIESKLEIYKHKTDYFYNNKFIMDIISEDLTDPVRYIAAHDSIRAILSSVLISDMDNLAIFTQKKDLKSYSHLIRDISELSEYKELDEFIKSKESYRFVYLTNYTFISESPDDYCILIRKIFPTENNPNYSLAVVFLPLESIVKPLREIQNDSEGFSLFLSPNRKVLAQNNFDGNADSLQSVMALYDTLSEKKILNYNDGYLFYSGALTDGSSIIMYYTFRTVYQSLLTIRLITVIITLITLMLGIILVITIIKKIKGRFSAILCKYDNVDIETLNIPPIITYTDEISYMEQILAGLVSRMNEFIKQEYEKSLEIKDYQLELLKASNERKILEFALLQAQINPHFIYNALSSIKWAVVASGNHKLGEIIDSLVNFFRMSLKKENFITIEEELLIVKEYVAVQQLINDGKFEFVFEIDDDLKSCYCIKLLLQPIVENAVIHGLNAKTNDGILTLNIEEDDDYVMFLVSDNGDGIDSVKSSQFNTYHGFGVKNIISRLKLYFGDRYLFNIESKKGEGTIVTIGIPKLTEKPEHSG